MKKAIAILTTLAGVTVLVVGTHPQLLVSEVVVLPNHVARPATQPVAYEYAIPAPPKKVSQLNELHLAELVVTASPNRGAALARKSAKSQGKLEPCGYRVIGFHGEANSPTSFRGVTELCQNTKR